MTGTLTLESAMYPTIRLMPTNNVPQHSVIEGSYVGATSFAAWEDASGQNRRMLEIRNKSYESSLDNAAMVRVCDNNVWSNYRIFHAGMETAVPIPNGGTGATTAADARYNLLVNTSLLTTTTPTTAILKGIQVSELPAAANGTQDPQGGVLLTAAINNNRGIQIGNGYAVDSLKWRFIHSNQTSDAGTTGYSPWYTIYHSGNIGTLATALSRYISNASGVSF